MPKETFTIVAFRYNQKNSILYDNSTNIEKIGETVKVVLRNGKADVISIRRVYEQCPIPKESENLNSTLST